MKNVNESGHATYSESRTINLDDYENIKIFSSIGITKKMNGKGSLEISESSKVESTGVSIGELEEALKLASSIVKKDLDKKETKLRKWLDMEFGNELAFDTMAKAPKHRNKKKTKKKSKR